jgi:hypothetical protein
MERVLLPFVLILVLGVIHVQAQDISRVEILVCKDEGRRLFFAGEKRHFNQFRNVFNGNQCRTKVVSSTKWEKTLRVFRKHTTK